MESPVHVKILLNCAPLNQNIKISLLIIKYLPTNLPTYLLYLHAYLSIYLLPAYLPILSPHILDAQVGPALIMWQWEPDLGAGLGSRPSRFVRFTSWNPHWVLQLQAPLHLLQDILWDYPMSLIIPFIPWGARDWFTFTDLNSPAVNA